MFYRVNLHAATRVIALESNSGAAPTAIAGGGFTNLGSFRQDNEAEVGTGVPGMQGFADNHTLFHPVQDVLYKNGIQDMQAYKIFVDRVRTISIGAGTVNVAVNASVGPWPVTYTPANATDRELVYTSSDVTKATVDSKGVVTGKAVGTSTITAKLKSNDTIVATRLVNVTA